MPVKFGEIRLAAQTSDVLGEVPLWNVAESVLTWIDVLKPAFHRLDMRMGDVASRTPPALLAAVVPTATGVRAAAFCRAATRRANA